MGLERYYRRQHYKVFKEYAKEAAEMTRDELEHAYVKARFAHTSFARIHPSFLEDFLEDEE